MEQAYEIFIAILTCNFSITVLGWIVWNVGLFSFTKDDFDDSGKMFPLKEYFDSHWDNWLFSAWMIPVLLIIGYKGMDLNPLSPIETGVWKWSDLYYFGAGFFAEAAKYAYKKWKKKNDAGQ